MRKGDAKQKGAQIDLLFERGDKVITVCELKYTERIESDELLRNFKEKLAALQCPFPKHGVQKVLILGKQIPVPQRVQAFFDNILFASELFFD